MLRVPLLDYPRVDLNPGWFLTPERSKRRSVYLDPVNKVEPGVCMWYGHPFARSLAGLQ